MFNKQKDMEVLRIISKYTYLLVGTVFIPLVGYFAVKTIKGLKRGSRTKKLESKTIAIESGGEVLKPLKCVQCGGIVASSTDPGKCQHCGTSNIFPERYKMIMESRARYEKVIQKALRFQRGCEFLTHPFFDKALLVLALWIIFSLLIIAFMPYTVREFCFGFAKNRYLLDMLPSLFTIFSLITAGILLLLRINFNNKTASLVPVRSFDKVLLSREEQIDCGNCGAPVQFKTNEPGHVCQYCGVESYRVNFVFKVSEKIKEINREANISLVNAMKDVEKAIDDNMAVVGILSIGAFLFTMAIIVYYIFDNVV